MKKEVLNHAQERDKNERGFIKMLILIIIVLVIASVYGFGPSVIWNDFIMPVVMFLWGIIVWIINFVVAIVRAMVDGVKTILEIIRSIGK